MYAAFNQSHTHYETRYSNYLSMSLRTVVGLEIAVNETQLVEILHPACNLHRPSNDEVRR
jgi:hypothetical protein